MKLVSIGVSGSNWALRNTIDAIIIQHPDTVKMDWRSVEAKFIIDMYFCVELAGRKTSEGVLTH
jgi:hypothetical protein